MSCCIQSLHCSAYLSDAQTFLAFRAVVFTTFCILFTCIHKYFPCKDLSLAFLSTLHFDVIIRCTSAIIFGFPLVAVIVQTVSVTSTHSCLSWKHLWAGKGKCKAAQGLTGDGLQTSSPDKIFYIAHSALDHHSDLLQYKQ